MALQRLNPPPLNQPFMVNGVNNPAWMMWFQLLYLWLGSGSGNSSLNAATITGVVASSNLPVGAAPNISNDAVCDSTDVDATNTTVGVHGAGGTSAHWNVYRNGALLYSNIAAKTFENCAYATDYYVGYNVVTGDWNLSTTYDLVTGDNVIRFHVRTHDSNGVVGAALSGGGGTAAGGKGGYKVGQGGGFGRDV